MKPYVHYAFCILTAAFLVIGCAGIDRTDYLSDYGEFTDGDHLEKVSMSEQLKNERQIAIVVQKPDSQKVSHIENADSAGDYLYQALLENLNDVGVQSIGEKASIPTGKYYVLETAITKLKKGNRAMRVLTSGLSGSAVVQVEGRIIDPDTRRILFSFADSRAGSGFAGLDITGGNAEAMMQDDMRGIAKGLAATLASQKS